MARSATPPGKRRDTGKRVDPDAATRPRRDVEVLDAAVRVFYARGYSDATVQDVADELGILKGSLYHYIRTKEDLLFRLFEEVHADVEQILEDVVAEEGLDPLERLSRYIEPQVNYNLANVERISIYYHDMRCLSADRLAVVHARRRKHTALVAGLIAEAQAAGQADPSQDPWLTASVVFATIIWPYRWYRPGRGTSSEAVAEACRTFALRGVVGPASYR